MGYMTFADRKPAVAELVSRGQVEAWRHRPSGQELPIGFTGEGEGGSLGRSSQSGAAPKGQAKAGCLTCVGDHFQPPKAERQRAEAKVRPAKA